MLHFWKLYPNFAFQKPTILSLILTLILNEKVRMCVIIDLFAFFTLRNATKDPRSVTINKMIDCIADKSKTKYYNQRKDNRYNCAVVFMSDYVAGHCFWRNPGSFSFNYGFIVLSCTFTRSDRSGPVN